LEKGPDASFRRVALIGLALVLAVVLASAAIRLGTAAGYFAAHEAVLKGLRALHRACASLEVLAAGWVGWIAWKGRARDARRWRVALVVLALTVFLAILGIFAGQNPSRLQALGNVLGGLALAAAFAWLAGAGRARQGRVGSLLVAGLGGLLVAQALAGGRLSIFGRWEVPALPLHVYLGLAASLGAGWLALRRSGGGIARLLLAAAVLAPLAGFTALQYDHSAAVALAHAASAALLVVVASARLGANA
jgi:hypothetical protein